jgi:hypothetical protein
MTKQSEAQRLADELDAYHTAPHHKQAAAELRRLEGELERKSNAIQRLWKERDDLRAVNAQLLEALESLASADFGAGEWTESAEQAAVKARAAIAEAKGQA